MSQRAGEEKRFVRRVVAWSALGAVLLTAAVLLLRAYEPQLRAARISAMIDGGQAAEALNLIDGLEGVSPDTLQALRYDAAASLMERGGEEEALAVFTALSGYSDAEEQVKEIRLRQAVRLEEEGKLEEAVQAYYLLGSYGDAEARYNRCLSLLYPQAEPGAEPLPASRAFALIASAYPLRLSTSATPATRESAEERLARLRARSPAGKVALGGDHTVMACADGTALAVGRDDQGQCQVFQWRNVRQVAAGRAHTLALLADGTVIATGDNAYGQCDVGQWSDVVQIAANDWDSFALLRDGTVAHCGYHPYPELAAWHGIREIAADSYGVIGLYPGGALASHPSMKLSGLLYSADVSRGYAVGLREDGTVVAGNAALPEWTDIVAVSAGENAVLALDGEGNVHACFFRAQDAVQPDSLPGRVTGIAAGSAHYALILEDGGVLCFGNNEYGQCDTADWNLNR